FLIRVRRLLRIQHMHIIAAVFLVVEDVGVEFLLAQLLLISVSRCKVTKDFDDNIVLGLLYRRALDGIIHRRNILLETRASMTHCGRGETRSQFRSFLAILFLVAQTKTDLNFMRTA